MSLESVLPIIAKTSREEVPEASVYLVGIGIHGPLTLTLEAIGALVRCRQAFGFPDTAWIAPMMSSLGSEFVQIEYPAISRREDVLLRGVRRIAQAALSNPPVAFVAAGSPIRHVYASTLLLTWARREGLRACTILGLSSLDHACASLGIDDSRGLQLFDATHLLALVQRPEVTAHVFIYNLENTLMQRSSVGTLPLPSMLLPLKEHLARFYPESHGVTFLLESTPSSVQRVTKVPLDHLESVVESEPDLGTLYVPPVEVVRQRPSQRTIDDLATLVRLARSPLDRSLGQAAATLSRLLSSER